jgi:hypothetical protein
MEVKTEVFRNSNIYIIDNFYKNPRLVLDFFEKRPPVRHKPPLPEGLPSFNHLHFYDDRHIVDTEIVSPVYNFLSKLCDQKPMHSDNKITTNRFKFCRTGFNTYRHSYWHPHKDYGYNGIVYLNDDHVYGTNLYNREKPKSGISAEHYNPWQLKENWTIINFLKPQFNRCVLFDGKLFYHGMHIPGERYFDDEYRLNQAFFFKE